MDGAGEGISDVFLNNCHCSWFFNNPLFIVFLRIAIFLIVLRFSSYDDIAVPKIVPNFMSIKNNKLSEIIFFDIYMPLKYNVFMNNNRKDRIRSKEAVLILLVVGCVFEFLTNRESIQPSIWVLFLIMIAFVGLSLYEDINDKPIFKSGINSSILLGVILPAYFLIATHGELETVPKTLLWIMLVFSFCMIVYSFFKKK